MEAAALEQELQKLHRSAVLRYTGKLVPDALEQLALGAGQRIAALALLVCRVFNVPTTLIVDGRTTKMCADSPLQVRFVADAGKGAAVFYAPTITVIPGDPAAVRDGAEEARLANALRLPVVPTSSWTGVDRVGGGDKIPLPLHPRGPLFAGAQRARVFVGTEPQAAAAALMRADIPAERVAALAAARDVPANVLAKQVETLGAPYALWGPSVFEHEGSHYAVFVADTDDPSVAERRLRHLLVARTPTETIELGWPGDGGPDDDSAAAAADLIDALEEGPGEVAVAPTADMAIAGALAGDAFPLALPAVQAVAGLFPGGATELLRLVAPRSSGSDSKGVHVCRRFRERPLVPTSGVLGADHARRRMAAGSAFFDFTAVAPGTETAPRVAALLLSAV